MALNARLNKDNSEGFVLFRPKTNCSSSTKAADVKTGKTPPRPIRERERAGSGEGHVPAAPPPHPKREEGRGERAALAGRNGTVWSGILGMEGDTVERKKIGGRSPKKAIFSPLR